MIVNSITVHDNIIFRLERAPLKTNSYNNETRIRITNSTYSEMKLKSLALRYNKSSLYVT